MGRDVGGACRRRRQAGGRAACGCSPNPAYRTVRLILSRSSPTPTACISSPGARYWIVRLANDPPAMTETSGLAPTVHWAGLFHELGISNVVPGSGGGGMGPGSAGSRAATDGWSVGFQALTYYYDDPDDPSDDPSESLRR